MLANDVDDHRLNTVLSHLLIALWLLVAVVLATIDDDDVDVDLLPANFDLI